jgi:hypothetical protein
MATYFIYLIDNTLQGNSYLKWDIQNLKLSISLHLYIEFEFHINIIDHSNPLIYSIVHTINFLILSSICTKCYTFQHILNNSNLAKIYCNFLILSSWLWALEEHLFGLGRFLEAD